MNKLNLYHFGDCGVMDELNPLQVYKTKHCPELLYLLATSNGYSLNVEELSRKLNLPEGTLACLVTSMLRVRMIKEKNNCFSINFPFFIESDVDTLSAFSKEASKTIGDIIIENKDEITSLLPEMNHKNKRIMYHIIGDMLLDGLALDYFSNEGILRTSKEQVGDRDYLLIGFDNSTALSGCSDNILCSSNNYRVEGLTFNSFGDSQGDRRDVYRMIRNSLVSSEFIKSSIPFLKEVKEKETLVNTLSNEENIFYEFYKSIGYFSEGEMVEFVIPVFDERVKEEVLNLSNFVLDLIKEDVIRLFSTVKDVCSSLASLNHGVEVDEIANELWHQLFGNINEYLVEKGFFAKPENKVNEGRYFQSLHIKK